LAAVLLLPACGDEQDPAGPSASASFAGAGGTTTKIAFTLDPMGDASLATVKSDGTGFKALVNSAGQDREVAYSPDGGRIAFTSDRDGIQQIYLARSDGRRPIVVTQLPAGSFPRHPAWSPDGTHLAFSQSAAGNRDIYLLDLASGGITRLTEAAAVDDDPTWSPDGTRIAFTSYRDGNSEIYTMSDGGTDEAPFTSCVNFCYGPAWSPDGQTIAYQEGGTLYTRTVAGGLPFLVTTSLAEFGSASWSPDGSELVFVAQDAGAQCDVYAIHPDGSGRRRITNSAAVEGWPVWKT